MSLTWSVGHVAGGAEAFEQRTAWALRRLQRSLHLPLDDETDEALRVSQKLNGMVVIRRAHVDAVNLKEEKIAGSPISPADSNLHRISKFLIPHRNNAIADLNLSIAMRDSVLGEARDENPVGSIDERCVAFAAGDAEAQALPDLIADERRVQRHLVNDVGPAVQQMRRHLVVGMWCWNLDRCWNDFGILLRHEVVGDGDFGELAVLQEDRMADQARHFTRNLQYEHRTARFQYFHGIVVVGVFHRNSVDLHDFVGDAETRQVRWAAFGDTRDENSLVVAFEWSRTATAGDAQAETG